MQQKAKFAKVFNLLNHVQHLIGDWSPLSHMGIEHCTGGFMSLHILKGAEGLIQHLNDLH